MWVGVGGGGWLKGSFTSSGRSEARRRGRAERRREDFARAVRVVRRSWWGLERGSRVGLLAEAVQRVGDRPVLLNVVSGLPRERV